MYLGVSGLKMVKNQAMGEDKTIHNTLNTIAWGFIGGRDTSSTRRRHICQILTIEGSTISSNLGKMESPESEITFFEKDAPCIHLNDNDHMVITIRCDNWEIKRVLIDQISSADILYLDVFEWLCLDLDNLNAFAKIIGGILRRANADEGLYYP